MPGLAFAYWPGGDTRAYPWDLPGLFVFAVFVLLLDRSKWSTLLYFLPLAALFKETSLVLCLALLFSPQTLSRRLRMFGLAVLCSVLVKGSMDVLVQNPIPLLSMTAQTSRNADTFVRLLGNADALRAVSRYSHQTQAVTFQHPYL